MILRWLSCLLCLLPMLSHAQPLRPNSGLWWEEPVTGRFYAVEIAPSGRTFVVVSEFDEQGKPVWRSLRGDLVVNSAQQQAAGAPLATLTAPLLELDGACPTCPVSAPNAHPSALGSATIVFRSNTEAEYQQGGLRRPLRYFSPADQPADFPSARLAGDYALALGGGADGGSIRTAKLTAANSAPCVRFDGTPPAPGSARFSASCPDGICESSPAGLLLTELEIAVDPGEHPSIRGYRRSLAPEGILRPLACQMPGFGGMACACPEGYTAERDRNPTAGASTGAMMCVANSRPMLCTESHRVSAQAGVLHGQPVAAGTPAFELYPLSAPEPSLRPNSGLWWEEPVTGRFFSVEIAPSGRTFVVMSEFDEQGKPVWRTMRGDLVVTSTQEQAAGAPLATLTAPLLELDGACPTCPVSAPNARPSALGSATIVFASEDRAEFQQGALRRPLRYFTPADQPADFPSARLSGDYVLTARTANGVSTIGATLQPVENAACTRYAGNEPAAGATWLRGSCQGGICAGTPSGTLIGDLELAVGPGEHPDIVAYKRTPAPEGVIQPICTLVFLNRTCTCPPGSSSTGQVQGIVQGCVRDDRPTVCTETHRISEQAGVLRGLPLTPGGAPFVLYPVAD